MRDAISLTAAGKTVIVESADPFVTAWTDRYAGAWWPVDHIPVGSHAGPRVISHDNPGRFQELATLAAREPCAETPYPHNLTRHHTQPNGITTAVTPQDRIAYHYDPATNTMEVCTSGTTPLTLARSTARAARELQRAQLIADGWVLLHAAAVSTAEAGILALGDRGAGKSTAALTLASAGASLIANDRVFARLTPAGRIELLPWPSAASIGLGLVGALQWTETIRAHLLAGEEPHPTQHQQVTDALLSGRTTAIEGDRKEVKAHIWPDQFTRWFGISFSRHTHADVILFPKVSPDSKPGTDRDRTTRITDSDFMIGAQEDAYPDIFHLAAGDNSGSAHRRSAVKDALDGLRHYAVDLSHDAQANAQMLTQLVAL